MDANAITTFITTVGFPIAMCCAMGWYVKYTTDKHREELTNERALHQEEMANVTEALNNNTLALQRLCDKLGD